MAREDGTGPIRLKTFIDIREDLYMLVLVGNLKKNLLKIHRREADNNEKAQQALIVKELILNSAKYPGFVVAEAEEELEAAEEDQAAEAAF